MGTGYYWCNLDKKERILPQLNGEWRGYKLGEWSECLPFLTALTEYIHEYWNGDKMGIYSEYFIESIEEKGQFEFKDIIIDNIPSTTIIRNNMETKEQ